jgi:hypothetical protein
MANEFRVLNRDCHVDHLCISFSIFTKNSPIEKLKRRTLRQIILEDSLNVGHQRKRNGCGCKQWNCNSTRTRSMVLITQKFVSQKIWTILGLTYVWGTVLLRQQTRLANSYSTCSTGSQCSTRRTHLYIKSDTGRTKNDTHRTNAQLKMTPTVSSKIMYTWRNLIYF